MANTYKDVIITPYRSSDTDDPQIEFRGANTSDNTSIIMRVYPDSNGTISYEGSAGQLFSIVNDLSGLLWGVNDVSGIPQIEVYANGLVSIVPVSGYVTIGNSSTTQAIAESFTSSAGPDTVDSFTFATTRSAEYFYTVIHDGANAYQTGKVILLNDGGGGHVEEYGVGYSNSTQGLIGSFSSTTNATHVILQFTPASTISYTVKATKSSMNV